MLDDESLKNILLNQDDLAPELFSMLFKMGDPFVKRLSSPVLKGMIEIAIPTCEVLELILRHINVSEDCKRILECLGKEHLASMINDNYTPILFGTVFRKFFSEVGKLLLEKIGRENLQSYIHSPAIINFIIHWLDPTSQRMLLNFLGKEHLQRICEIKLEGENDFTFEHPPALLYCGSRIFHEAKYSPRPVEPFLNSIKTIRTKSLHTEIETFFAHLDRAYATDRKNELEWLYSLLLDHDIRQRIVCDDDTLNKLQKEETKDSTRTLTHYYMNRIFLHALVVDPSLWTDQFCNELRQMLDCVYKDYKVPGWTIDDYAYYSYSPRLLQFLEYRFKLKKGLSARLPDPCFYHALLRLPQDIKNDTEWKYFTQLVSKEYLSAYYRQHSLKINLLLKLAIDVIQRHHHWQHASHRNPYHNHREISEIIGTIPSEQLMTFFDFYGAVENLFKDFSLSDFLKDGRIPQDVKEKILEKLSVEFLRSNLFKFTIDDLDVTLKELILARFEQTLDSAASCKVGRP